MRDVLTALGEYVEKTRAEPTGKEALAAFHTVRLRRAMGASLGVSREGDTLELELDRAEGLGDRSAFFAALDSAI